MEGFQPEIYISLLMMALSTLYLLEFLEININNFALETAPDGLLSGQTEQNAMRTTGFCYTLPLQLMQIEKSSKEKALPWVCLNKYFPASQGAARVALYFLYRSVDSSLKIPQIAEEPETQ